MTAIADLDRIARAVIPPVGATGWRLTVLHTSPATAYAVVPVLFGRVDGSPVFCGTQADCTRFHKILSGEAAPSRRAPVMPPGATTAAPLGYDQALAEAAEPASRGKDPGAGVDASAPGTSPS